MSLQIDSTAIDNFLHFGYLPRPEEEPPVPLHWMKQDYIKDYSSEIGGDILRAAVNNSLGKEKAVIVPISGGLDSRAILSICLELGYEVEAVTIGVPGTFDYEIGRLVAKKAGVKHTSINLNEVKLDTTEVVKRIRQTGDFANALEIYYCLLIPEKFGTKPIALGFLGDFLAGEYASLRSETWEDGKKMFCELSKRVSDKIISVDKDSLFLLPETKLVPALNDYEEITLRARHTCTLRPTLYDSDFNYKLPFRDEGWVNFITGAPKMERMNKKLYKDILLKNWPLLFSLPCKNENGASIQSNQFSKKFHKVVDKIHRRTIATFPATRSLLGINRQINYIDFNQKISNDKHFKDFISEQISDLTKRNVVTTVNPTHVWNDLISGHKKGDSDENNLILILTNLEINLKANSL